MMAPLAHTYDTIWRTLRFDCTIRGKEYVPDLLQKARCARNMRSYRTGSAVCMLPDLVR